MTEELRELKRKLEPVLSTGNCTSGGAFEDLQEEVNLLKDAVLTLLAVVVEHRVLSLEELQDLLRYGWRIDD